MPVAKSMLVGYAGTLVMGAFRAFQAIAPARIRLPSRSSDFWQWTQKYPDTAVDAFLKDAELAAKKNEEAQNLAGLKLANAIWLGQIALAIATLGGVFAVLKY